MLRRYKILGLVPHLGCRKGFFGIAARFIGLLKDKRLAALIV
jgi:hypothetical protein